MSPKNVCRLCLASDAPVHVIVNTPLEQVYKNLTNVSLQSAHKPSVACSICYWQLRKCHNLMMRSLRADKLLTSMSILQTGASMRQELIAMIDRTIYKLNHNLKVSPMELNVFTNSETTIKEENITDEPLSYENEEGIHQENIYVANIKVENAESIEEEEQVVDDDVTEALPDGDDMSEDGDEVEIIDYGIDIEEIKIEDSDTEEEQVEDIVPTVTGDLATALLAHDYIGTQSTAREERKNSGVHTPPIGTPTDLNLRTHPAEMRYECAVCQKKFLRKRNLKLHLQNIHNGVKPYRCATCKKSFWNKYNLKIHTRIHTGEKPFECTTCGKRFTRKSCLAQHLKIHSSERHETFECKICTQTFKVRSNFDRHIRTHTVRTYDTTQKI